ncbi:phage head closure protein [Levilactobacillus senmaizukei]|uniref:phage head closure protein n=1 Tax=Levilactobacillus senmaizukei TaxID=431273 RepID=UPI00077B9848|nr:phage head closure protein [Levilactobacillus senmaizukei]
MTRLTNHLKHRAKLLSLVQSVNEDDLPIDKWQESRVLNYQSLGVTATEKFQSMQAKTDVVKRIRIRFDPKIDQLESRVMIAGKPYLITRLYVDDDRNFEELSLNYVD